MERYRLYVYGPRLLYPGEVMNFDHAIEYVLQNEGGYSDESSDRGGRTNYGITESLLQRVMPGTDIRTITEDVAKSIYKQVFWDFLKLDQLPQLQATCIFDVAVNAGPGEAVKIAQTACGFVVFDGVMGPKTIAALQHVDDDTKWLHDFIFAVQMHLVVIVANDSSQFKFLAGWLKRTLRMILLLEPV